LVFVHGMREGFNFMFLGMFITDMDSIVFSIHPKFIY
jgi:hypothetical protein